MNDAGSIDALNTHVNTEQPVRQVHFFKALWNFIKPYWQSDEKVMAWVLLFFVTALNVASIYASVSLNQHQGGLFDALQNKDKARFFIEVTSLAVLIVMLVVMIISRIYLENYLEFNWRMWLTRQISSQWLKDNTFYRLYLYNTRTENPDQRISQDLAAFPNQVLSLSIGLASSFAEGISFSVILWSLSKSMVLTLSNGYVLAMPGYMLWFTWIYVAIVTYFVFKVGKPLVQLDYLSEKYEADLRFQLMRIRERREEVALLRGGDSELQRLKCRIKDIRENFMAILKRNLYINSIQNFTQSATIFLPYIAASPMLFAGTITLGTYTRLQNAFMRVEYSFLALAYQFQQIAAFRAGFARIENFLNDMETTRVTNNTLNITHSENNSLVVSEVKIYLPQQTQAHIDYNFTITPGEKVLLSGPSGVGKSSLLRCIEGSWPHATGTIQVPRNLMIIPQRPYFPIASLRECLYYPNECQHNNDDELQHILALCHLNKLTQRLDEVNDWNTTLSMGEQQRLNFARVFLIKPAWLLMDEPTASMDKQLEKSMFKILIEYHPQLSILTISHSIELIELHDRQLHCHK